MWAEIVAFDLPDPDVTSITESVNERYGDFTTAIGNPAFNLCYGTHSMLGHASTATVFKFTFLGAVCLLAGCHTRDADEGSVRATRAQVLGVYETKFDNGSERLELKDDGTYVQDFTSKSPPLRHIGRWRMENLFLDGSEVVLVNAALSDNDATRPTSFGDVNLYTHERSGKVALARNEVADWYYEQISK
ncbi:MAG: hypothetical protein WCA27_12160 [Candidatus Sulfotelmatobacter sp.]